MSSEAAGRSAALGVVFLIARTAIAQICVLGGGVVLARTLAPEDYGVYSILQFALAFFALFGDAGVGGALIRSREAPSERVLSSVFWFQILASTFIVALVWVAAPLSVVVWKKLPISAVMLLRAMSLTLLLTAARVVPMIQLERNLRFGVIAGLEVAQTLAFYVTAVACALSGLRAWTWACAMVTQAAVGLVIALVAMPWRPKLVLAWSELKPLIAFGIPYQAKNVISFVNSAVTPLYAGAMLGPAQLGYLGWGQQTAYFPLKVVDAVTRVIFPLLSRYQEDRNALAKALGRGIHAAAVVVFFFAAMFLSAGENITHIVFSDRWLPGLFPLYVLSSALCLGFLSPLLGAALDAIGKPGILARLMVVWTVVNWVSVAIGTHFFGPRGFVVGFAFHILVGNAGAIFVAKREIPEIRLLSSLRGPFLASLAVGLVGRVVVHPWASGPLSLIAGVLLLIAVCLTALFVVDRSAVVVGLVTFLPARHLARLGLTPTVTVVAPDAATEESDAAPPSTP
jgi:O-antigen/teichoic acid export membrane protein